jgi:hypothetical protein
MISYFTPTDGLRIEVSPSSLSPYQKFMYALNSKESKRQYPKRSQYNVTGFIKYSSY